MHSFFLLFSLSLPLSILSLFLSVFHCLFVYQSTKRASWWLHYSPRLVLQRTTLKNIFLYIFRDKYVYMYKPLANGKLSMFSPINGIWTGQFDWGVEKNSRGYSFDRACRSKTFRMGTIYLARISNGWSIRVDRQFANFHRTRMITSPHPLSYSFPLVDLTSVFLKCHELSFLFTLDMFQQELVRPNQSRKLWTTWKV